MIRVNILCEGTTEELFVTNVLYKHFILRGIALTGRPLDGGFNYERLKYNIIQWLNEEQGAYVTTLVDLYGTNKDYPGYLDNKNASAVDKVTIMEKQLLDDVLASKKLHNQKFIPYFQLHEFEALLFSNPKLMEEWFRLDHHFRDNSFAAIRNSFETPEHINDSKHTAPSKRIENIIPSYVKRKTNEGVNIVEDIGLEKLREECKHFDTWVTKLESLAVPSVML